MTQSQIPPTEKLCYGAVERIAQCKASQNSLNAFELKTHGFMKSNQKRGMATCLKTIGIFYMVVQLQYRAAGAMDHEAVAAPSARPYATAKTSQPENVQYAEMKETAGSGS